MYITHFLAIHILSQTLLHTNTLLHDNINEKTQPTSLAWTEDNNNCNGITGNRSSSCKLLLSSILIADHENLL